MVTAYDLVEASRCIVSLIIRLQVQIASTGQTTMLLLLLGATVDGCHEA